MALNPGKIERDILDALKLSFGQDWSNVSSTAVIESKKIARTLTRIESEYVSGSISEQDAKTLLKIQLDSARMVFLALQGMSLIAVEKAINNAFSAIGSYVNSSVGFVLCSTGGGSRDH
jgi:hypothetical protein